MPPPASRPALRAIGQSLTSSASSDSLSLNDELLADPGTVDIPAVMGDAPPQRSCQPPSLPSPVLTDGVSFAPHASNPTANAAPTLAPPALGLSQAPLEHVPSSPTTSAPTVPAPAAASAERRDTEIGAPATTDPETLAAIAELEDLL